MLHRKICGWEYVALQQLENKIKIITNYYQIFDNNGLLKIFGIDSMGKKQTISYGFSFYFTIIIIIGRKL